jgi:hypothetical protein
MEAEGVGRLPGFDRRPAGLELDYFPESAGAADAAASKRHGHVVGELL